jgi:hypothetical protein
MTNSESPVAPRWLALALALAGCQAASAPEPARKPQPAQPPAEERLAPQPQPQPRELELEVAALRRALAAKDVSALERLLAPEGVLCGDYMYGPVEFDILVRQPGGALRPWLFGEGGKLSARSFTDGVSPRVSAQSSSHREAVFWTSEGSLMVGYALRGGRWLISEGLFCL